VSRPSQPEDLDAEQEVDLRSVWERIAARWWLPVIGVVLGPVIGFALALGGGKVYEAETLVAMGQPFSPNGGAPVAELPHEWRARSRRSSARSPRSRRQRNAFGLRVRALRGNVTSADRRRLRPGRAADGRAARDDHGDRGQPLKAEKAADALAKEVIRALGAVRRHEDHGVQRPARLDPGAAEHARAADRAARAGGERARVSRTRQARPRQLARQRADARRGQLLDLQSDVRQQLALAENVEKAQVVEPARRSRRPRAAAATVRSSAG
jgi:hypothetical protein